MHRTRLRLASLALLLAVLCGLSACRQRQTAGPPDPAQTTALSAPAPTAAGTSLVPFEALRYGIRGLAPEGWAPATPGRFERVTETDAPAVLFFESHRDISADRLAKALAAVAGIDSLPGVIGHYRSDSLNWDLFVFEMQAAGFGAMSVDLALAEQEGIFYLAVLAAGPQYAGEIRADIFERVLEGLVPIPADDPANLLSADMLLADHFVGTGPVSNDRFAPSDLSEPARHSLEGTLTVHEFGMGASPGNRLSGGELMFPGFSVSFITVGDYLVPAQRDLLDATGRMSAWRLILSPGRVWSEPEDGGMSRAAFPFVLASRTTSAARNGLATFLYDDKRVSSLRFQVVQEILPWEQSDLWGQWRMTYEPGQVTDRALLAAAFSDELAGRLPVRPWSELEGRVDRTLLDGFNGLALTESISAAGLLIGDALYVQPCYSRFGHFPYCQEMRHGSFSVSKSMGAAIALLRLAEKYGPEVFDLLIRDYVNITATHEGWQDVTFGDVLNMTTGVGSYGPDRDDPGQYLADDSGQLFGAFTEAASAREKLEVAFSYGNYPWGPGEVARYNSSHTFVLGAAMQAFLQSKEGPDADIWDMVMDEVYRPIGIAHAPIMRTVEPDGSRGLPVFAWGMYPTADEAAQLARLLVNGGQHQGRQLLHAGKLEEALRQTGFDGFPTGEQYTFGEGAYFMSFWSVPYVTTDGRRFHVPYMSGYGGNRILFNPNGVVTFWFTDSQYYDSVPMMRLAEALEPIP